jgi:hypothetical protein
MPDNQDKQKVPIAKRQRSRNGWERRLKELKDKTAETPPI